jgi:hypothetical protein
LQGYGFFRHQPTEAGYALGQLGLSNLKLRHMPDPEPSQDPRCEPGRFLAGIPTGAKAVVLNLTVATINANGTISLDNGTGTGSINMVLDVLGLVLVRVMQLSVLFDLTPGAIARTVRRVSPNKGVYTCKS